MTGKTFIFVGMYILCSSTVVLFLFCNLFVVVQYTVTRLVRHCTIVQDSSFNVFIEYVCNFGKNNTRVPMELSGWKPISPQQ